jgi:hypothetical protein
MSPEVIEVKERDTKCLFNQNYFATRKKFLAAIEFCAVLFSSSGLKSVFGKFRGRGAAVDAKTRERTRMMVLMLNSIVWSVVVFGFERIANVFQTL